MVQEVQECLIMMEDLITISRSNTNKTKGREKSSKNCGNSISCEWDGCGIWQVSTPLLERIIYKGFINLNNLCLVVKKMDTYYKTERIDFCVSFSLVLYNSINHEAYDAGSVLTHILFIAGMSSDAMLPLHPSIQCRGMDHQCKNKIARADKRQLDNLLQYNEEYVFSGWK